MLDQALGWLFDKVHGLGFAVTLLAALLGWAASKNDRNEVFTTLVIWAVTIALFSVGGRVDRLLYDPIFGVKGVWRSVLDGERKAVREKFSNLGWQTNEIQEASRSLFEQTSGWDKQVKMPYEISKACRTFVIPLFLLLVYDIMGSPGASIIANFRQGPLGQPWLVAALWLVMVVAYLALRVLHNKRLYELVVSAEIIVPSSIADASSCMLLTDEVRNTKESGVKYKFVCFRAASHTDTKVASAASRG